jgi:hypothetical protein
MDMATKSKSDSKQKPKEEELSLIDKATVISVELKSLSPYSQSKFHQTPKLTDKELPDKYEERTWRNRVHLNERGRVILPGMSFKKSLVGAALLSKKKITGKGQATWNQHIISGISPLTDLETDLVIEDILPEWIHCDAQGGAKGVKTRVLRCYPLIKSWHGVVEFINFDPLITQDIFTEFLMEAGLLIGVGRFRPANGGTKGRFKVIHVEWKQLGLDAIEQRLAA